MSAPLGSSSDCSNSLRAQDSGGRHLMVGLPLVAQQSFLPGQSLSDAHVATTGTSLGKAEGNLDGSSLGSSDGKSL